MLLRMPWLIFGQMCWKFHCLGLVVLYFIVYFLLKRVWELISWTDVILKMTYYVLKGTLTLKNIQFKMNIYVKLSSVLVTKLTMASFEGKFFISHQVCPPGRRKHWK